MGRRGSHFSESSSDVNGNTGVLRAWEWTLAQTGVAGPGEQIDALEQCFSRSGPGLPVWQSLGVFVKNADFWATLRPTQLSCLEPRNWYFVIVSRRCLVYEPGDMRLSGIRELVGTCLQTWCPLYFYFTSLKCLRSGLERQQPPENMEVDFCFVLWEWISFIFELLKTIWK